MTDSFIYLVPEPGIEPGCPCERGILSPLRLPVSPLRHSLSLLKGLPIVKKNVLTRAKPVCYFSKPY